ncbi:hypothetical protein ASG54_05675 [Aureimonas sp. Leaf460]|nr:hypothetical protein ASG62_00150 [Aureimonas sp. Leaf427]KQT80945.1 hypothetical protein ASG54_05675 [Aureimonas sp. Leaf460]
MQDGALRFEVRDGDHPIIDGSPLTAREQATVVFEDAFAAPVKIGFDLTIDPGAASSASYLSLARLTANLPGGAVGGSVFGLDLAGEQLTAYVVSLDAAGVSTTHRIFSALGDIVRGATYSIEVTAVIDADGTGRLVLDINGERVANYVGAIGSAGQDSVSWSEGILRAADATETISATFAHHSVSAAETTSLPLQLAQPDIPTIKVGDVVFADGATDGFLATLTGTGLPGLKVAIYADGAWATDALIDASGRYSAHVAFETAGVHAFTAVAIDAAGTRSVTSYATRVLIGDIETAATYSRIPFALAFDNEVFEVDSARHPWSIQALDDDSLRFELRDGDRHPWDAQNWHTAERSEVSTSLHPVANGTAIQLSYGMLIEPGAANTAWWMVLGQLHQDRESGGPPASPPVSVVMIGERMGIQISFGTSIDPQTKILFLDSSDVVRGHLYEMRIAAVFDPTGASHLTVERDGVTLVDYKGPLGYVEQTGVYWAEGIYRSDNAAETIAVQYHDLDIVTGDSATFAPEGSLIQAPVLDISSATLSDDGTGLLVHIGGTVLAGSIVTILEAGIVVATVTADERGSFSADLALIGTGPHGLTAYATSAGSRTGLTSAPSVVLGTTAEALAGRLGTLADLQGLQKIVLTDDHVLHLSAPLQLTYALGRDAAALAKVEGGLSIVYSQTYSGRTYDLQLTTYTQDGRIQEIERFAGSKLVFEDVFAANGSHVVTSVEPNGATLRSVFTAANQRVSSESFDGAGRLVSTWALGADGSQTTHTYAAATGLETRVSVIHADKTKTDTLLNVEGRAYTTQITDYDAAGHTLAQHRLAANGVTIHSQIWNADGSRIVHTYAAATGLELNSLLTAADGSRTTTQFGIANKAYAVEALHYNAANQPTGFDRFDASGIRVAAEVWNADGSKQVYTLNAAGLVTGYKLTAADGSYANAVFVSPGSSAIALLSFYSADGHLTERQTFDTAHQLQTVEIWTHEGLYSLRSFSDPSVIREASYDTADRLVSRSVFDLSGKLLTSTQYEIDGSRLTKTFDAAGLAMTERTVYADGSRNETFHHLEGRAFTDQSITYDASGRQVDLHRWNGDKLVMVQTKDADGSFTSLSTDGNGFQTASHRSVDGTTETKFLDPNGALLRSQTAFADGAREWHSFDVSTGAELAYTIRNVDGSREVADLAISGRAYATQHAFFDAAGKLTDMVRHFGGDDGQIAQTMHYGSDGSSEVFAYRVTGEVLSHLVIASDGSRAATSFNYADATSTVPSSIREEHWNSAGVKTITDVASADGAHKITGHVTGLTVESNHGVSDVFSLSGGDLFVFGPSSGHDTIVNFHAANGPLHDTIEIDSRIATSFSDLALHAVGENVVISLGETDSITLTHVALADVTADDFRFF